MTDYKNLLGEGMYFSLNKKIELRKHPNFDGSGLFAKEPIKVGEVIWSDNKTYQKVSMKEAESWPRELFKAWTHFAYQVSETEFLGPPIVDGKVGSQVDASNYMNHSCDPACWFDNDFLMTARRDIAQDEEVTFDYCTSELNETKKLDPCLCGAQNCRKVVTMDDWKIRELQENYAGHFQPYLNEMIAKLK
jgi:hypothetical protein